MEASSGVSDPLPRRRSHGSERGVVRLVWERLDAPSIPREALEASLSGAERVRAERFADATLRIRWIAARGILRHLLAQERGCAPREIPLQALPRRKPSVEGPGSFNLSHSGVHLLVAFVPVGRVGVDVEELRPLEDLEALAKRFFTPGEARAILALPGGGFGSPRHLAFFRTWVRKEAFVKGVGLGVSAPLDAFEVDTGPAPPAARGRVEPDDRAPAGAAANALLGVELAGESGRPWQVRSVPSPPGVEAAVAWDAPELVPETSP